MFSTGNSAAYFSAASHFGEAIVAVAELASSEPAWVCVVLVVLMVLGAIMPEPCAARVRAHDALPLRVRSEGVVLCGLRSGDGQVGGF